MGRECHMRSGKQFGVVEMLKNTKVTNDYQTVKDRLSAENKGAKNKIELAYKEVCETRRFEIQMYWHRAAYFWAFIVSIYTAFFFISGNDGDQIASKEIIKLALAFLGFVFCLGFYFSNKGSKVWQENWEILEGLLEDEVSIKLYKTFYYDAKNNYSVSKINDWLCGILSAFSFVFFAMVLIQTINLLFCPYYIKLAIFVMTLFCVMLFLHIAKKSISGNECGEKELEFKKVEYHD